MSSATSRRARTAECARQPQHVESRVAGTDFTAVGSGKATAGVPQLHAAAHSDHPPQEAKLALPSELLCDEGVVEQSLSMQVVKGALPRPETGLHLGGLGVQRRRPGRLFCECRTPPRRAEVTRTAIRTCCAGGFGDVAHSTCSRAKCRHGGRVSIAPREEKCGSVIRAAGLAAGTPRC